MRNFEKFLFFYSILAITVFFISYGIFSPQPLNLISGGLMLPMVAYFWLRLTSPEKTEADRWSVRFLVSIVVLAALGIYGFYLAKQAANMDPISKQLTEVQKLNEDQKRELDALKSQLTATPTAEPTAKVAGTSIAELVTQTPEPGIQRIKLKSGVKAADVYQNPDSNSKKIGSLNLDISYPYLEKQDPWYKVAIGSAGSGWVSATQVEEVQ